MFLNFTIYLPYFALLDVLYIIENLLLISSRTISGLYESCPIGSQFCRKLKKTFQILLICVLILYRDDISFQCNTVYIWMGC